jgi:uncharacterized protein (TIGR02679 family)
VSEAALDPALERALLAARIKREQRGASGSGTVVVADLKADEALALDSLLSVARRRPVLSGRTLRVPLSQFEAALTSCGFDPRREYERLGAQPLHDLPAERAARRELRVDFRSWLDSHEVLRAQPAVAAWLDQAVRSGRVHPDIQPLVAQALRIVERLLHASDAAQRTVLAAEMVGGDPHALDVGTALHGLTVSLLAAARSLDQDTAPREVWAAWNVVVDPISSNVAVLNLPPLGSGVAAELARAARGTHLILTYGQLAASDVRWPVGVPCFSCENPSVLIAAEEALGVDCPPLVCTGGRPSDAVRLLFSCVGRPGGRVRHHGDFDDAGVQILRDLEERYGAVPWRFDADALGSALRELGRPEPDASATALERAVHELTSPVPEELLVERLIEDLAVAASAGRPEGA